MNDMIFIDNQYENPDIVELCHRIFLKPFPQAQPLGAAIKSTYGEPARPILQWAASDARFLRKAGFRAAEYGPGEIQLLHAQNERVQIDQLEQAVRVYESLIRAYVV